MIPEQQDQSSYQTPKGAAAYLEFITSADGKIHQGVLGAAVLARLEKKHGTSVLDVGCGNGWLTTHLQKAGFAAEGCDASEILIQYAKNNSPLTPFMVADMTSPLPYPAEHFDNAVLVAAALDTHNLTASFKNICTVIKPGGKLISVIVNPYYASPVGKWKRGWKKLFGGKPKLELSNYADFAKNNNRVYTGGMQKNSSYFYSLPEQVNAALAAGFSLSYLQDILSNHDSPEYDMIYRLYRFPLFLLAEFTKTH